MTKNRFVYISIENPKKEMNKLKGVFKPLNCYFKFSKKDHYPVLWCSKVKLIHIISRDVMWKDKYDSPRYECSPYIWIHLFGFNFIWYWDLPENLDHFYIEDYWEQDYKTKKSSWNDIFLIRK